MPLSGPDVAGGRLLFGFQLSYLNGRRRRVMNEQPFPKLTPELLRAYADAALNNSEELLAEAALLLEHDHMARAYFLAFSSVEEAGKALLAFHAQLRNLADPAVCARLKAHMADHRQKITYALSMWALNDSDQRAGLEKALDLALHLAHGREPSMYSDLRADPDRVQTPREVVRDVAARDCVKLAEACLANARRHLSEKTPTETTAAQDSLLTMKSKKFHELMSTEEFYWYYLGQMEAGQSDFAEAVIGYERDHINTGVPFRTE